MTESLKRTEDPENCIFLRIDQEVDDPDKGCGGIPITTNTVTLTSGPHADRILYPEQIITLAENDFKGFFDPIQKVEWHLSSEIFDAIKKKAQELKAKGF